MEPSECKPGMRVYFWSVRGRQRFLGTVECEPWCLPSGYWVVHLCGMEPAYGRKRVVAACLDFMEAAPSGQEVEGE